MSRRRTSWCSSMGCEASRRSHGFAPPLRVRCSFALRTCETVASSRWNDGPGDLMPASNRLRSATAVANARSTPSDLHRGSQRSRPVRHLLIPRPESPLPERASGAHLCHDAADFSFICCPRNRREKDGRHRGEWGCLRAPVVSRIECVPSKEVASWNQETATKLVPCRRLE
jgi:hypothetical protein